MSAEESRVALRRLGKSGEPAPFISTTSRYSWLYNDQGSGGHHDVTFWRPIVEDPEYYLIGDYIQPGYSPAYGTSYIVKAVNDDPQHPVIKPPTGYNQIWTDRGSGGDHDGSIWFPVPPNGYIAIGWVCQSGYSPPSLRYGCIRMDFVEESEANTWLWSDAGSGSHGDVTAWNIAGVPGAFAAQPNYHPFSGHVFRFRPPQS
jgi:hypothetical protein